MKARFITILTSALLAASCSLAEESRSSGRGDAVVSISVSCGERDTRSQAFGSTGSDIEDLNLYIWDRGVCVAHAFLSDGTTTFRQIVSSGGRYTIYALANAGRDCIPTADGWERDEESMRSISVGRRDREWTSFPMAGTAGPVTFNKGTQSVDVKLSRLVAKIGFRFSPDDILAGQDLKVKGVSLRNAAAQVYPFVTSSSAVSVLAVDDSATDADLLELASGGEAYFYTFENCRGRLLPDNDDPWSKVPDSLGDEASLCTYLEVECSMSGNGVLGGDVTYRFYPGADNTSDFSICRNTSYNICLYATGGNVNNMTWKINSDVEYTYNSLASLHKDKGLHPLTSTWVGEMFTCSLVDIDKSVLAFFGGSLESLRTSSVVRCLADDGGADLMEFSSGSVSGSILTGIEGTVRRAGTGSVWLCTKDGEKVVPLLRGVTVYIPVLRLSYDSSANYPEAMDEEPTALINGEAQMLRLYLCDNTGLNLMADTADQYGFSSEPFSFSSSADAGSYLPSTPAGISLGLKIRSVYDSGSAKAQGQPFAVCAYSASLSDAASSWNYAAACRFTDACHDASPVRLTISDSKLPLSVTVPAGVSCMQVQARYLPGTGELEIINPSHIPLSVRAYEFTIGDRVLKSSRQTPLGSAVAIPSSVSAILSSSTVTRYSAVAYSQPRLYVTPVRTLCVAPSQESVSVGEGRWLVGASALGFKGYEAMGAVNAYYGAPADPYSRTGMAIDVMADGYEGQYRIGSLAVGTSQEHPHTPACEFAGLVLFSAGRLADSDIAGKQHPDVLELSDGSGIVYSPETMSSLLSSDATLITSSTLSLTAAGKNSDNLTVTLYGGKPTEVSCKLSLYGEVTVYPKGTSRGAVSHFIGPDSAPADAKVHCGSTSEQYRQVSALRSSHSLSLPSSGSGTLIPLKNRITTSLFTQTETDSRTQWTGSNSFQHQYHPIDYYLELSLKTAEVSDIYKGTFSGSGYTGLQSDDKTGAFFTDNCFYQNSGYYWNKNNDAETTWSFNCRYLKTDGVGYICVIR